MTEKKENFGCLTSGMRDFMDMNEKKRLKNYGRNGVSKMYERIRKNVEFSFLDAQTAYEHLPEKQREKIDLVRLFDDMLTFITKQKLTKNLPDVPVSTTISQLNAILNNIKDKELKRYSQSKFKEFVSLLEVIESQTPIRTGTPTSRDMKLNVSLS